MRALANRLARVIGIAVLLYSGVIFFGNAIGAMTGDGPDHGGRPRVAPLAGSG